MSALYPLQDPLTRQKYLPTEMNWRGAWSPTTQYYSNDLVRSSASGNVYRAIRPILGGPDGGPNWEGTPFPWVWTNAIAPTVPPLSLTSTNPVGLPYTFLQARRTIAGPNPTQTFYARFDVGGNVVLEHLWDGFIVLPLTINARPLRVIGDDTSTLTLSNEQSGGSGVLTVDAANDLYWNGVKLN